MRRSCLDNGIRVVTEEFSHVASVAIGIWVQNGSRYEDERRSGISHFIEHLLFKGTERRTAAEISEEIEGVGGSINAFTGSEYTCYYVKVLSEHLDLAFDLLADIVLNSRFDPEEIERERAVIVQEIAHAIDTPDEYIHDLFKEHFWRGHPLSRQVCGTTETVSVLQREDFLQFMSERYGPDRIVIAAAGRVNHDDFADRARANFGSLGAPVGILDGVPPVSRGGVVVQERSLEQVHLCLGMPAIAQTDPRRYAAFLLETALGGGMSSRLFQEIRERRGRAYAVNSFLSCYRDAGYLGVYVGTKAEWIREVLDVSLAELRRLANGGLGREELTRAKNQLKGNMLLGLETSTSRMHRLATCELHFGRDIPFEEVSREIEAVTNEAIIALAAAFLEGGPLSVAVLGDLRGERIDDAILRPE